MCTHIGDFLVFIRRPVLLGLALFSCSLIGEAGTDAGTGKADSLTTARQCRSPRMSNLRMSARLPFESLPPQPSGFLSWSALTGDWGGARSSLNEAGIGLKVLYRTDQMSNLNGGSELRSGSINHLDLMLSVDAGTAFGIGGMLLSAHVIANNGGSISRWVGDAQMVSNLEASKLTKLYQLWISQSFAGDHLSVLLGLYDLNSEFYVTPRGGIVPERLTRRGKGIVSDRSEWSEHLSEYFARHARARHTQWCVRSGGRAGWMSWHQRESAFSVVLMECR